MRKNMYVMILLSTMLVSILFAGCGANKNITDDVARKTTQVIDDDIKENITENESSTEESSTEESTTEESSTEENSKEENTTEGRTTNESSKEERETKDSVIADESHNKDRDSTDEELSIDDAANAYIETERKLLNDIISQIITNDMNELEKVKAIHDYMLMNIDYDYDNYKANTIPASSYSIVGALKTKYAVCQGYALTFKGFCELLGIECIYVRGRANNEAHGWNQVKVNGNWYNIDVTWDDPTYKNKLFDDHNKNDYSFFLVNDDVFYQTHTPTSKVYSCTAESICEMAFLKYGCPWIEGSENISYTYIDTVEDFKKVISSMVNDSNANFTVAVSKAGIDFWTHFDEYADAEAYRLANKTGLIRVEHNSQLNYMRKYYVMNLSINRDAEYVELVSTEEEMVDYILNHLKTEGDVMHTRFFTSNAEFDGDKLSTQMLYDGYAADFSYTIDGSTNEYYMQYGYYVGNVTCVLEKYTICNSYEEIKLLIDKAIEQGEEMFLFVYLYDNQMNFDDYVHNLTTQCQTDYPDYNITFATHFGNPNVYEGVKLVNCNIYKP